MPALELKPLIYSSKQRKGGSMSNTYEVNITWIQPNPWQSRLETSPEYIENLARDIELRGLLQPPLGRLIHADGRPVSEKEWPRLLSNASKKLSELHPLNQVW
jgi:hypothetical protein